MFLRQCKTHNHKLLTPTIIFHIGRNLHLTVSVWKVDGTITEQDEPGEH